MGPFKVVDTISSAAVRLKLSLQQKGVHPVVSISNVQPYVPDQIQECHSQPKPTPEVVEGQEEFEIEKVLDSRFRYGQLWYLIKFVSFPNSENKWIPNNELKHAPNAVQDFHHLHPSAPHISSSLPPSTKPASRRSSLRRG